MSILNRIVNFFKPAPPPAPRPVAPRAPAAPSSDLITMQEPDSTAFEVLGEDLWDVVDVTDVTSFRDCR